MSIYDWTECDEVAANIPLLPAGTTMDECLAIVRRQMPEESNTVLANVAEALWHRLRGQGSDAAWNSIVEP